MKIINIDGKIVKDNETYLKILAALQSEKVSDYILENYGGGVVPAFGK